MRKQEVFDTVAAHLLKQGTQSLKKKDGDVFCMYRGPRGLKCAVGTLIPDELYDPAMEHSGVHDQVVLDVLKKAGLSRHQGLLSTLQSIHDGYKPSAWREALREVAAEHRLKKTVLEAA